MDEALLEAIRVQRARIANKRKAELALTPDPVAAKRVKAAWAAYIAGHHDAEIERRLASVNQVGHLGDDYL